VGWIQFGGGSIGAGCLSGCDSRSIRSRGRYDPLTKATGPRVADYALAVAEAGAFHSDLILELRKLAKSLQREPGAWATWKQVSSGRWTFMVREIGLLKNRSGVLAYGRTGEEKSYEVIN